MKEKYHFKITVESTDPVEEGKSPKTPLAFEVSNHDNILAVVKRLRLGLDFDPKTSTSFAVGLKLLTEVILENRNDPLFSELKPAVVQFMKKLKAQLRTVPANTQASAAAADTCVDLNGPATQVSPTVVAPQSSGHSSQEAKAKDILNEVLNEVLDKTPPEKVFFKEELMQARSEASRLSSDSDDTASQPGQHAQPIPADTEEKDQSHSGLEEARHK